MENTLPVAATDARRQITHEELMQLPILRYGGPIHLVKSAAELTDALHAVHGEQVIGFDTETRPTFKKGQSHPPSLVQLATSRAVYLFQLKQLDCSHTLAQILGSAQCIKAGIALDRDILELKRLFPFESAKVVDLGNLAKWSGYGQTGVRNLTGLFLGGRITKGAQTSNWAQSNLTHSQIIYAATDAWICRELYLKFESLGLLDAKAPVKTKPTPPAQKCPAVEC